MGTINKISFIEVSVFLRALDFSCVRIEANQESKISKMYFDSPPQLVNHLSDILILSSFPLTGNIHDKG